MRYSPHTNYYTQPIHNGDWCPQTPVQVSMVAHGYAIRTQRRAFPKCLVQSVDSKERPPTKSLR
eukprot:1310945-Amphidinium_carterae.3